MECLVVSSREEKKWENIKSLLLPALQGEAEILPGHAESFIQLKPGVLVLRGSTEETLPVTGGICYVHDNKVLVVI